MVCEKDRLEFLGQIIDIFDDFLSERNVMLDKKHHEVGSSDPVIYGDNYFDIEFKLDKMMSEWGVTGDECSDSITIIVDGGIISDVCISKNLADAINQVEIIDLDTTDPCAQAYNEHAIESLDHSLLMGSKKSVY